MILFLRFPVAERQETQCFIDAKHQLACVQLCRGQYCMLLLGTDIGGIVEDQDCEWAS